MKPIPRRRKRIRQAERRAALYIATHTAHAVDDDTLEKITGGAVDASYNADKDDSIMRWLLDNPGFSPQNN